MEKPYIEAVLKEWKMYCSLFPEPPRIRELHLGGGTPTFFGPANLEQLIRRLMETGGMHPQHEFSFEGHPGNTTREHLKVLYNAGFRRVSFGIQDFDPVVQDVIHRRQSFEQVKTVTEEARKIGYTSVNYDLIYGLPLQTLTSVRGTIEKVKQLKPDRIAYYSYAHVPWMKPGQRKFTELDLPDGEAKRQLYESGRDLLEDAGYAEVGMDHFARRDDSLFLAEQAGMLHRNFMGYTTSDTRLLIGLGVSAIGDTWHAFGQNVKVVEEYTTLVNNGRLPLFRGHFLDNEDAVLRRHIHSIMCKMRTSWHREEEQCAALYEALERLQPMMDDGLVQLEAGRLNVLPDGKPFLRNVCMAFDARFWRYQPSSTLFSRAV